MLQKFVVIFEANLRLSPDCGVSRFDILHTLSPLPYTLFKKRALGEQKFTVLAEFSASTAENSASTADFSAMGARCCAILLRIFMVLPMEMPRLGMFLRKNFRFVLQP